MSDCMSMVLQLFISALITMLVFFPTIFFAAIRNCCGTQTGQWGFFGHLTSSLGRMFSCSGHLNVYIIDDYVILD